MKKRNHQRYELVQGQKTVYRGITDDPARREQEHKNDNKRFTGMRKVGPLVTKDSAEKWEKDSLATYRSSHGGKNPRYNKTDEG